MSLTNECFMVGINGESFIVEDTLSKLMEVYGDCNEKNIDFSKCAIFSKKQQAVFVGKQARNNDILNATNYIEKNVPQLTEI